MVGYIGPSPVRRRRAEVFGIIVILLVVAMMIIGGEQGPGYRVPSEGGLG